MSQLEDQILDYLINGDEFEDCHDIYKNCPICGRLMITKKGKFGTFRGCSNFPECDYTEDFNEFGKII